MTETLSIRIDSETKQRAKAITAPVRSEEWQLSEIQAGIADLDSGKAVGHDRVADWMKTWGRPGKTKASQ